MASSSSTSTSARPRARESWATGSTARPRCSISLTPGLSVEWVRTRRGARRLPQDSLVAGPLRPTGPSPWAWPTTSSDRPIPLLNSLTSWDVGVTWRPWKFISLAASARDFDNPALASTGAARPAALRRRAGPASFWPVLHAGRRLPVSHRRRPGRPEWPGKRSGRHHRPAQSRRVRRLAGRGNPGRSQPDDLR